MMPTALVVSFYVGTPTELLERRRPSWALVQLDGRGARDTRLRHAQPLQPAQASLEERVHAETDEPESDDAEQRGTVRLMAE
jgi:hypothetical protein